MQNLNVVLIPYWLRDLLAQQGQHLNSVVDYGKIKSLLSADNKITLLQTQDINMGRFSSERMFTNAWLLSDVWSRSDETSASEIGTYYDEATRRNQAAAGTSALVAQLRLELDTPTKPYGDAGEVLPKAEALDSGTGIVLVVIGSDIGKISQEEMYELVQSVLRIFYKYESPYKVANHPFFRTYLDMMRLSKMISD